LKKLLLLAVIGLVAWSYYQKELGRGPISAGRSLLKAREAAGDETSRFHCDGRQYCSQMRSRAEAEFFLAHCPGTRMDGDHDGIPCENDSRF